MGLKAQQAYHGRTGKGLRSFISHIQYRRHFITILRLKTAYGEVYTTHQVSIDKAQSLLLSAANQKRTVNFKIVYVDKVLIKVTPTYRVLRSQLIPAAHQYLQLAFNTTDSAR
ncbi:hypothetical protein D3C72_923260 [compost metagenome]